ncbi:MAG: hypothetical protein DRP37_02445 [Thermodesulfobacteriota bacterium]|nr:MAG: hypothetical protein DRP37_02445 [Thermodesulfobacteriota bacterium]
MLNKNIMRRNNIILVLFAYLILGIFLLPIYRYQINADGISYISIAQKYLDGDFKDAINGYWGPLFSWLLIPFLSIGLPSLLSCKILSLLIGLFLLYQYAYFLRKLNIQSNLFLLTLACSSLITLSFAFSVITPDLLFAAIGILYLNLILDDVYLQDKRTSIFIGIVGGLLYLTKGYGLPFFITSFIVVTFFNIIKIDAKNWKIIISNFLITFSVFGLISGSWILLISRKYGYFTFSTASYYNFLLTYPHSLGLPMHWMGLLSPPNCTAISIWEDISFINVPIKHIDFYDRMLSFVKNFLSNSCNLSEILCKYSILSPILILISIISFSKFGIENTNKKIFLVYLFMFILVVGYLVIIIESRYIWVSCFLLLAIGSYLLNCIYEIKWLRPIAIHFFTLIFFLSFCIHPIVKLYKNRFVRRNIFQISTQLEKMGIRGKIASDKNWGKTLYLSFYLHSQYFGEKGKANDIVFLQQVLANHIDYLFIYDLQRSKNILSSNDFKLITKINYGKIKFAIYQNLLQSKKNCTYPLYQDKI